ncbi:MAG: hypothetical protein ACLP1X_33640 [Polyangiaceae bacterium]
MTRRQGWAALGLVGATGGAALLFTACGSSSSGTPSNPADATTDQGLPDSVVETPDTGGQDTGAQETSTPHEASTADASDASSSSCTPYDASGLDEASVAAGFTQVWQVYKCWGCHQNPTQTVSDAGAGIVLSGNDAGLGDSGLTWPPNLTGDPATGLGCWTDPQIQNAILNGQDPEGGALCPSMPVWGHTLMLGGSVRAGTPMDAGTAQEIVDFLRSLPPVVNHLPDTTCPMPDGGTTDGGSTDGGDSGSTDATAG